MVVRTLSMAVIVFWATSATSMTATCAEAGALHRSTMRRRLPLSCLRMALSLRDRDAPTIRRQFLRATIHAVERAQLPLRDIHTAAEEQTPQHEQRCEECAHLTSYCHIAGRLSG